jgi:acyl carrier protein
MTETQLEQDILRVFKEFSTKLKGGGLSIETSIDDLQLDSLDTLDLLMQIDNYFQITIPVEKFALCKNLEDLKRLIQSITNS